MNKKPKLVNLFLIHLFLEYNMKHLTVKKININVDNPQLLSKIFDDEGIPFEVMDSVNWQEEFPYKPDAAFRVAHNNSCIFIDYRVRERNVKAVVEQDDGNVWEDSCCEFFSQPGSDGAYYNMECSCVGKLLIGCGENRAQRRRAPQDILDEVLRWSSLGNQPFGEKNGETAWRLSLVIPLKAYFLHEVRALSGQKMRANFYKCGDKMKDMHFLSWNKIQIDHPDFHRPDYFGELEFE